MLDARVMYEWAGSKISLIPLVREAALTLGFVREESIDWLTNEIGLWQPQPSGRFIREAGTRLKPDERLKLGLAKWEGGHISHEVWEALTTLGREAPQKNFDATCDRAIRNGWLIAERIRDNRFLEDADFFPLARFKAGPSPTCVFARRIEGEILTTIPELPFPQCDQNVCGCGWRLISNSEAKRLGLI